MSSGDSQPALLGAEASASFPAGTLYLSPDPGRVLAHAANDPDKHLHAPAPHATHGRAGPWPRWVVLLLVGTIALFHVCLVRVIYAEYCRSGPG